MVVQFLLDGTRYLLHVLGQRNHHLQVFVADTQSAADGLKLVGAGRVLSARHGRCQVVADDDRDVSTFVDGIQQARHARVGKRGVTDDGYCRPLSGIAGTLGHRDAGTHIHTGVDGLVGRQEAQRVAAYVAKHTGIGILQQHLVQRSIDVAVATALTQCRRTWCDVLTGSIVLVNGNAQRLLYQVRIQLTCTRQLTSQAATDDGIARHHATHLVLNERLTFLAYQHLLAVVRHAADELLRNRILRNLQHRVRTTVGEALHQVVVGNTRGNDAQLLVLTVYVLVVGTIYGVLLQQRLLTSHHYVTLAGKGRQQHPVGCLRLVVQLVLLTRCLSHVHHGTRVGHAGGDTHQHGQLQLFRHVVGKGHHVVSLLLGAGLQCGHHRKLTVEA